MASVLRPDTIEQLRDAVAWGAERQAPLEIMGSGTMRGIGRAVQAAWTLDTTGLSGIVLYEPDELVVQAHAGTPRAEIEQALEERKQEFAFEPPDLSSLLGTEAGGTLGGIVAANLSGPRRLKAGAVRDHFLGFKAVSGRGEVFKGGGRVVKNVTGYDLAKLMAGSWGTLAVLSEVTLKALPRAETQATVLLLGLDDEAAARSMSIAMQSACEVSGAAHIPAGIAARSCLTEIEGEGTAVTALRLEGVGPSVDYRANALTRLLQSFGPTSMLDRSASAVLWEEVRDVLFFADRHDRPVWRISVPPMDGPRVLARIRDGVEAEGFYDWAGGLVWCEVAPAEDAHAPTVRAAVGPTGGHATLIRAAEATRAAVDVFEPLSAGVAGLTRRLKQGFDPHRVLNPGRMYKDL